MKKFEIVVPSTEKELDIICFLLNCRPNEILLKIYENRLAFELELGDYFMGQ